MGVTLLYYVVLCVVNGLGFYVVLRSLCPVSISPSAVVGINAFGWIAGLLAVGAPGGIGVRDATAAVMLAGMMPPEDAIVGAVVWRVVQMLDELLCVGLCWLPTAIPATKAGVKPPLIIGVDQKHAIR